MSGHTDKEDCEGGSNVQWPWCTITYKRIMLYSTPLKQVEIVLINEKKLNPRERKAYFYKTSTTSCSAGGKYGWLWPWKVLGERRRWPTKRLRRCVKGGDMRNRPITFGQSRKADWISSPVSLCPLPGRYTDVSFIDSFNCKAHPVLLKHKCIAPPWRISICSWFPHFPLPAQMHVHFHGE